MIIMKSSLQFNEIIDDRIIVTMVKTLYPNNTLYTKKQHYNYSILKKKNLSFFLTVQTFLVFLLHI